MISLQPFLLGAALASFASAAALEVARQDVDCYTIWADGHRNHVPTYYETVVQKETSRFTSTSSKCLSLTSFSGGCPLIPSLPPSPVYKRLGLIQSEQHPSRL